MTAQFSVRSERVIRAPIERVFAAWTEPRQLVRWWGPAWVTCPEAEVDLRVGGGFRLANRLEDGTVLWIAGEYQAIDRPARLVFSWFHEPRGPASEVSQVDVTLSAEPEGTRVVVLHTRLATQESRDQHGLGWAGCLDGLEALSWVD